RDSIERAAVGEARYGPEVLAPAGASDPRARRDRARALCDATDGFIEGPDALEIDGLHRRAGAHEVDVRVGEAGEHTATGGVDRACAGRRISVTRAANEREDGR